MIHYHELTAHEEIEASIGVQMAAWNMPDRSGTVTNHMIHAIIYCGGNSIGAFDGEKLVGFTLALPARRDGQWGLWSHMAAVLPDYQSKGVGKGLKLAQRQWALGHGYGVIGWTFDPLQRGNARFNLHHLAAVSRIYHVNFYGELTDGINAGMPTDRLEITWNLNHPRVVAIAGGQTPNPSEACDEKSFLLRSTDKQDPELTSSTHLTETTYCVEIPYDLAALKRTEMGVHKAMAWQASLGEALQTAFEQGYSAVDFAELENRCWYVLRRNA